MRDQAPLPDTTFPGGPSPAAPVLGIVLVVYKSPEDTAHFVRHELPKITRPYRAVVVDLASPIAVTRNLAAACGGTFLAPDAPPDAGAGPLFVLHSPDNLGYARGNNLGARFLLDRFPSLRWLLFSNTDVELLTPGLDAGLIQALEDHPDAACAGPRVLSRDGTEQLPFARPIPAGVAMWHNASSPFRRQRPSWDTPYKVEPGAAAGQYCYWVSGCFLLCRAADFVAAGMFDEATFLYGEEAILSERLQRQGKRFFYEPALGIRHHCGGTTSRHLQTLPLARSELASSLHYYRTYRRLSGPYVLLFRLCGAVRLAWVRLAAARAAWRRSRRAGS